MTRKATRAKTARKAKPARRRLSRPLLENMLGDLVGRLRKLSHEAEAFSTVMQPNGKHVQIEYQTRTACCVMLDSLQHHIRDAEGLAQLLVRDEVAA